MKEPSTLQNGDRFGTFVKRIRQKDPREITSIRLADYLGISPTRLCDIEANRRCPTDMEKVGRFCEFFHLDARVRSRLYELAAEARYTIPVFVGGDMTRYQQYDMDRFALRVADWGDPDEEEWKKIIRKAQASGAPLNTLTREDFEALIAIKSIDPIYKVITGDENNASEMGAFCNQFDKICTETGCSVIYCHHHSKGSQGMKRAMDRASGSGVFARDPDAQLDMIELELTDDIKNNVRDGNATAWRLESSLREFPNITPINFWFEYPIHRVDVGGILGGMPAQGTPKAGKLNNPKSKSSDEAADEFRTAYDALNMDGKVTVADLADYLGISDKTVYSRLKKMDGEYLLEKGAIRRSAPAQ